MRYSEKVMSAVHAYNAARAACFAFDAATDASAAYDAATHAALLAAVSSTDAAYVAAFSKAFSAEYRASGNGEQSTRAAVTAVEVAEASAAAEEARAAIDAANLANDALSDRKWNLGSARAAAHEALDAALAAEVAADALSARAADAALFKCNPTSLASAEALTYAANAAADAEVAERRATPPSAYAAARAFIIGPVCYACDAAEADCRCSAFDGVYTS